MNIGDNKQFLLKIAYWYFLDAFLGYKMYLYIIILNDTHFLFNTLYHYYKIPDIPVQVAVS